MCGLTGFFQPVGFSVTEAEFILKSMRDYLIHRGPDDAGVWLDGDAGIALGHRRLSILDLSQAGHQPMTSASGRYVLVLNGEIYNHKELRKQLDLPSCRIWCGNSDTETLLAAVEAWGLDKTLKESVGMFAMAMWDRQDRQLLLARDRMGEKPLYYGWQKGVLLFGSELKVLRAHPSFQSEIDSDVLPLYFQHGYIPAPWCIWKGMRKLLPGTWVSLMASDIDVLPNPTEYWSFAKVAFRSQAEPLESSDKEAADALEDRLAKAITGQCQADVPVGAFLSGGIDSSTVVALMQAQSSRPIKTFTIGFNELGYNEAQKAKGIAQHLGTDHTELYVTSHHAKEVVPQLSKIFDEPFGDSSALPTILVSNLARQDVTVSLSGDGGDELFGGYGRYFNHKANYLWRGVKCVPQCLKPTARKILTSSMMQLGDSLVQAKIFRTKKTVDKFISRRAALIVDLMNCENETEYYRKMISQWQPTPMKSIENYLNYGFSDAQLSNLDTSMHRMMAQDSITYLPDDILVKLDRSAMSVALETRVPMLDHKFIELAWRVPYSKKVRNNQRKWILKQILYKFVPKALLNQNKMGFGVPVGDWIRGPLREWSENVLDSKRLNEQGLLNEKLVRQRWQEHLEGKCNWAESLWIVLMWQEWLRKNSTHE